MKFPNKNLLKDYFISAAFAKTRASSFAPGALTSYLKHRGLLLTDEHADVRVTQVSAVDLFVSSSRIHMRKCLIDLQGPHPFVVHPVGGDTPLLPE